ncbi:unnamed protein product [Paramecium sonneborni]|uniref:Uncharacterized protein n=1 Tax=Paramecium sonneborni TaxID=65129 RepID=A0A8S1Q2Y4_9CILI|nr:unnamed protein product [Paramecium sonneborni]
MASGCGKKIKLWNFKFGQIDEFAQLNGHEDLITCLLFSQNNRNLISASQDFQLRLWRENNNLQWISSQAFQEHLGSINCCIMNQSESFLITGSDDQTIKVWRQTFIKIY